MNIDKILSDEYYTFLENNHNVAFYSLSIGLEEYFETYHQVCVYLSEYERDDKEKINYKAEKNGIGYIKSYLNIAIHIQHFFELETKRLLEKEHVLWLLHFSARAPAGILASNFKAISFVCLLFYKGGD